METRERMLGYIEAYIRERGYSPSLREIGDACEIGPISVVDYHVKRLIADGRITQAPLIARSIRVVATADVA